MNIKDRQIDFLRWVLANCKNSPYDAVVIKNPDIKKLFEDTQDMFYLDSGTDMEKLYAYYEKDNPFMQEKICSHHASHEEHVCLLSGVECSGDDGACKDRSIE